MNRPNDMDAAKTAAQGLQNNGTTVIVMSYG